MKTAFHIVLRSWKLPWQEKQLLILPVFLFVALYISEYLAKILGLELDPNNRSAVPRLILFVLYHMATDALFYTFLAAFSVAIALRVLNEHDVDFSQILSDLRLRARPLIALALVVEILILLINTPLIFFQPLLIPTRVHLLSNLTLLALFLELLVKTLFLLALPTIVNEKGRFLQLLQRSWQHSSKIIGTILTSVIGLLFTLTLLGVAFVILDAILGVGVIRPEGMGPAASSPLDGLLLRNYQRLLVLPVCWSYQALLYRHARDQEPT